MMDHQNVKNKAHMELALFLAFVSLVIIITLVVGNAFFIA